MVHQDDTNCKLSLSRLEPSKAKAVIFNAVIGIQILFQIFSIEDYRRPSVFFFAERDYTIDYAF